MWSSTPISKNFTQFVVIHTVKTPISHLVHMNILIKVLYKRMACVIYMFSAQNSMENRLIHGYE